MFDIIDATQAGDDDDSTFERILKGGTRIGGEIVENVYMGGIASQIAIPDPTKRKKLFGDSDPTRFGTGNLGIAAITDPLLSAVDYYKKGETAKGNEELIRNWGGDFLMPFGGTQVNRTLTGLQDLGKLPRLQTQETDKDGNIIRERGWTTNKFPASYDKKGDLRFPIEGNYNKAITPIFGAFATGQGKEYLNNDRKPQSPQKTKDIENLFDMGLTPKESMQGIKDLSKIKTIKDEAGYETEKSKIQKIDSILGKGYSSQVSDYLFQTVSDSKIDINAYKEMKDKFGTKTENEEKGATKYAEYIWRKNNADKMTKKERDSYHGDYNNYIQADKAGVNLQDYAMFKASMTETPTEEDYREYLRNVPYGEEAYSLQYYQSNFKESTPSNAKFGEKVIASSASNADKIYYFTERAKQYKSKEQESVAGSGASADVIAKYYLERAKQLTEKGNMSTGKDAKARSILGATDNLDEQIKLAKAIDVVSYVKNGGKKAKSGSGTTKYTVYPTLNNPNTKSKTTKKIPTIKASGW